jgi:hypothetical protein
MQFAAHVTKPVNQCLLDVHVDVFQLNLEGQLPTLDYSSYLLERLHNLVTFLAGEDTDFREHLGVGDRALDIMLGEPIIEADALGKSVNAAICRLAENT